MSQPLLSILICTTYDRRRLFEKLYAELCRQQSTQFDPLSIEILYEEDGKQMSVGAKRQKLLLRSRGEYISYFDSDDWPFQWYLTSIMEALKSKPDCVGFLIHMTTNGKKDQTCCHSLQYREWATNVDGYDYVRNVTHFNPVRRDLALKIGFKDMRFGEDRKYSDAVTKLCKTEVFINKKLFHYRYSTAVRHNIKYGIKK
jgi:hypothetical protein